MNVEYVRVLGRFTIAVVLKRLKDFATATETVRKCDCNGNVLDECGVCGGTVPRARRRWNAESVEEKEFRKESATAKANEVADISCGMVDANAYWTTVCEENATTIQRLSKTTGLANGARARLLMTFPLAEVLRVQMFNIGSNRKLCSTSGELAGDRLYIMCQNELDFVSACGGDYPSRHLARGTTTICFRPTLFIFPIVA